MVNSGARGTKQERRPTPGPRLVVSNIYTQPTIYIQVPSATVAPANCSNGTPGDVAASGSSMVLPRAAAGTRGQHRHSTLHQHHTGASIVRYAMQGRQRGAQERRREGGAGTRERGEGRKGSLGLLVVRQQELG
jgi:hypothetical protein